MSVATKAKVRVRSDNTSQQDNLEIKTFNNGSSPHHVTTSVISSNGANRESAFGETEQEETYVTPYSIDMDDPYRYGYRHIFKTVDDIITITGRIPLTLEDLLHPEEEDRRVQNPHHSLACYALQTGNVKQFADDPDILILHDVRIDWNVAGIRPFGPDITIVLNGKMEDEEKGTYVVGEDGDAPIMVFEVTSPSTRPQDFFDKPILMQQIGLPYYFVIDIATRNKRVYGYELNEAGCYIGIRPDEQERVWVEPAKMWLGLNGKKVECFDADGNLMLSHSELAKAFDQATLQASQEAQRAEEEAEKREEADLRAKMAEKLRQLGIDPDTLLATNNS